MDSLIFVAVPVLVVGFFLFLLAKLLIAAIRWLNRHWRCYSLSFRKCLWYIFINSFPFIIKDKFSFYCILCFSLY